MAVSVLHSPPKSTNLSVEKQVCPVDGKARASNGRNQDGKRRKRLGPHRSVYPKGSKLREVRSRNQKGVKRNVFNPEFRRCHFLRVNLPKKESRMMACGAPSAFLFVLLLGFASLVQCDVFGPVNVSSAITG